MSVVLHQICNSHGIYLAVVDVLYQKNIASEREDESFYSETNRPTIHKVTANKEWDIDDNAHIRSEEPLNDNKDRTIVESFSKSPVKNDVLQKNCQAEFNKKLSLIMDTRTQWNSLLKMLSRFLEIRTAVENTLKDLHHGSKYLDESEISLTKHLKETLKIIKVGATALSCRDVTLLKNEKIFEFIIQKRVRKLDRLPGTC